MGFGFAPTRFFGLATLVALSSGFAVGCSADAGVEDVAAGDDAIVDVPHTAVERQSIGNCWLYAHATWAESMHKAATGEDFDISQSYWTYWHWFDQIVGRAGRLDGGKISTGGRWTTANKIVNRYGLMAEKDFVFADTESEASSRQLAAMNRINTSLASGALSTPAGRANAALVRSELNRAWDLSDTVIGHLDSAFGTAGERTFESTSSDAGASTAGTTILNARDFRATYAKYDSRRNTTVSQNKSLHFAMTEWKEVSYVGNRRVFQQRVQRALHVQQPVIITWDVDFNALENNDEPLKGSFNLTTLRKAGKPGRLGGHMTVLEDYKVKLSATETLEAGVTLNPANPQDRAKLQAALAPAAEIVFFRVKNSWGGARPDRAFAKDMPGYHDLYMDYLNGPITWCSEPEDVGTPEARGCNLTTTPLRNVVVPPGF